MSFRTDGNTHTWVHTRSGTDTETHTHVHSGGGYPWSIAPRALLIVSHNPQLVLLGLDLFPSVDSLPAHLPMLCLIHSAIFSLPPISLLLSPSLLASLSVSAERASLPSLSPSLSVTVSALTSCLPLGEDSSGLWRGAGTIRLEQDVFSALAGQGQIYVYLTEGIWSQIKSAGSALYASRLYLGQYQLTHPERLAKHTPGGPRIRGNVYIHPTAKVAPSAVLGPNVSIGEGVTVGEGVRLRESIVLHGATLQEHTCVLHSIVGWGSTVGRWARVEGTPNDPNPNDPRAHMDSESLFKDGKLLPAITILGCRVRIPAEVLILNSIVLPHKELSRSFTNQIIL
ncbi:mannose-1-phosphate guanylyltransferase regulatory subunit alpha isoform X3 [Equus przewalskii]|uniref:Mannose-1-phosphate guanylyltransferase regulatory subunit alpha isoform X3 n=1 Tax=Equus przewalskii TaxID=9798 RepID=A0ABM4PBB1_EQUPR